MAETGPARTGPRRTRLAIIGGAAAVVVAILVIIVATSGDDSPSADTTPGSGIAEIHSPASVAGITGVPVVTATNAVPELRRTLLTPGRFDCATTGSWQPYAEVQIVIAVGEPPANTTCGPAIIDLPAGYCSTKTCAEVPADWRVEQQPGVTPGALMLVVAPLDASTGQFVCLKASIELPKQILPLSTTIEIACASDTSDSVEIPYVPPATSDIPFVPPPVSVDIPST